MRDILSRADIKMVIDAFYEKVKPDATIGFIFNDLVQVNWEEHLPVMYDFWESTVFGNGKYTKNAMTPHIVLNQSVPFTQAYFDSWLLHFTTTVDALFSGENAELMKNRAIGIAGLMQIKLGKN